MSISVIPKKVCARLEEIRRDFPWDGDVLEKKASFGELEYSLCK